MPDYDAFGREIGENALSGLGGSDATIRPEPAPAPSPAAPWTEPPPPETPVLTTPDAPPQPIRVRRTRGLGCLVGLVILAAVVVAPVIAVVSFVGDANDAIDSVTDVLDDAPAIESPDAPATPPAGIERRSMIAPGNVAQALRSLKRDGVRTVAAIRIWPDRLQADTVKGRRQRDVEFGVDGSVQRGDRSTANRAAGTIALAGVDPRAPARLVRSAAKQFRVRERGIGYVIASPDIFDHGRHRWIAYFKNGTIIEGDARGAVVRRIS